MGVKVMDAGGRPLSCSHIEFRFISQPFLLSSLESFSALLVYLWSGRLFANPPLFLCLKSPAPFPHSAKEWWFMPSIKHCIPCEMLIITAHCLHVILTTTLLCLPHSVILSRLFSWLLLQKVLIRVIWDALEERLMQCWGWGALHTSCHCLFHWPPRADGTLRFDVHGEAVGLCDWGCRFPKAVPESPPSLALSSFSRSHHHRLLAFMLLFLLKNKFVCSVAKACPVLCDPMDCSTPGFSVLHHLLEFGQTHAHWVSDAIQPSHPLSPPSPLAFSLSQCQGLFQWINSLHQVAKVLDLQLQQ